jgi:hypothetical protein
VRQGAGVWVACGAVALVAVLGVLRSFDGFGGDQALFLLGAQKLHAGGVLYRDFWDLKQPGIFAFYLAAGSLAGFSQSGIHEFEIAWQCVFGVLLWLGLRRAVRLPAVAAFAALAIPGAYYAGTNAWHLTQVEALTGLPLFCCAWGAAAAWSGTGRRGAPGFLSGLGAGCAVLFKLLYAPVALAIFLAAASLAPASLRRAAGVRVAGAWTLGLLLPPAAFAAYATAFGLWPDVVATFFSLPSHLVASGHAPVARLAASAVWFLRRFAPLALLAVPGAFATRAPQGALWQRIAFAWLATGAIALAVQTQSWWEYQFLLLLPPLGILATLGLDVLLGHARQPGAPRRVASAAVLALAAVLCFGLLRTTAGAVARVFRDRPFASAAALERDRELASGEYRTAARAAGALPADGRGLRAIYVCGDPLIYLLAHRDQAVAINGWALELYPPGWWARLNAELQRDPPADEFVSAEYAPLIAARSPEFERNLETRYLRAVRLPDGSWYRLKTSRRSP